MTGFSRISLAALLALGSGAPAWAAVVRVAPVQASAAPAAGAAGAAVRTGSQAPVPINFSPSVLPTLPALKTSRIQAAAEAMLPAVEAEAAPAGVGAAAQAAFADTPETGDREGKPVSDADIRRLAEKWNSRVSIPGSQSASELKKNLAGLAAVFDGAKHREGIPAVRTEAERAAIAAKTSQKRDYLAQTRGLQGKELVGKLHDLTGRGYRSHDYKDAKRELFSNTDNFEKDGVRGVVAAYSNIFVPGTSGDGTQYGVPGDVNGDGTDNREGMNVEHLWPQSYFSQRLPMRSDLHHLMATFVHPNSERSRYPFGEVPDHLAEYRNNAGAKLGGGYFEPPDTVKGRVARGLLYFYVRYHNNGILPSGAVNRFWNGRLETLLRWNREFPPDVFEMRRNDLVEEFQGNRNPFVDDHALADKIGEEGFRMDRGGRRGAFSEFRQVSSTDGVAYDSTARAPAQNGPKAESKKRRKEKGVRAHYKKNRKRRR